MLRNSGVTESLFIFFFFLGGGGGERAQRKGADFFFFFFLGGGGGLEDGIAMIFSPLHLLCTIKIQMGGGGIV